MTSKQLKDAIISDNSNDILQLSKQLSNGTLYDGMHWAATNGYLTGVQLLAPNFSSPGEPYDNPLVSASQNDHINVVKWLCSNTNLNSEIVNWAMKYALEHGSMQCFTYLHSLCDFQDDDDPYYKSDDDLIEWAAMCKNFDIRKKSLSYLLSIREWPQKNINKAFMNLTNHQYRNMREDEISSLSSPSFHIVYYALKIIEDILDFELLSPDIDTVAKCMSLDETVKGVYIKNKYVRMWNSGLRCSNPKYPVTPECLYDS